jgi:hypothetical protein
MPRAEYLKRMRKPGKRGGSAAGKLLGDSAQRIADVARYKAQGKSDRWISRNWIIRHKRLIAQQ